MKRRGLASNSALALAADLAGKGGLLVLTVVAARLLPLGEFALWATAIASVSLLAAVLDGGAQTLLTREGAAASARRGGLLRALTVGRLPFALVLLAAAPLVGAWRGHPLESFAAALLAIVAAAGFTLTGVLRSAQDLRPEAVARLAGALLALAAGSACLFAFPRADVLLLATAAANLVALWPLARRARRLAPFRPGVAIRPALRAALPLGLMGIATLIFYRAGTLALAVFSTSGQTAAFTIAANLGFGLLALPNAITTGLLPRLADERDPARRTAVARRALTWTAALCFPLFLTAAFVAPLLLPLAFGSRYADAATPLALLCAGSFLIALNGIVGTALIAAGRLRLLAVQVALSLVVNVVLLAMLTGPFGAVGAAAATLCCELVGLAALAVAAQRHLPGLLALRFPRAPRAAVAYQTTSRT